MCEGVWRFIISILRYKLWYPNILLEPPCVLAKEEMQCSRTFVSFIELHMVAFFDHYQYICPQFSKMSGGSICKALTFTPQRQWATVSWNIVHRVHTELSTVAGRRQCERDRFNFLGFPVVPACVSSKIKPLLVRLQRSIGLRRHTVLVSIVSYTSTHCFSWHSTSARKTLVCNKVLQISTN